MSSSRHDPDRTTLVRTFGVTFRRNDFHRIVPPTAPGCNQLIYATRGMMTVRAENSAWAVPPHRAILVPAGISSQVEMHGEVAIRMLYLKTARPRKACAVVNVSPLMRELILRAVALGALDSTVPEHKHLHHVIRDEIKTLQAIPLQLPAPADARALRFAELARNATDVSHLLQQCGASRRTMERIFLDETGLTLGQWLRRQKLLRALQLLAAGHSVKHTALELGYANPSAFIAMFRRESGATPSAYFDKATAPPHADTPARNPASAHTRASAQNRGRSSLRPSG